MTRKTTGFDFLQNFKREKMTNGRYWVYMLLCENNTYYTGYTNNLENRYLSHLDGSGKCKYTRSFKPVKIAQSWEIKEGRTAAMRLERHIQKLSHREKEKLVNDPKLLWGFLL